MKRVVVHLGREVGTGGYSDGTDLVAVVPNPSEGAYKEMFDFSVGYMASDKPFPSLERSGKRPPCSRIAHGRRLDSLSRLVVRLCTGFGLDRQGHEHACTSLPLAPTWSCSDLRCQERTRISFAYPMCFFIVFLLG